MQWLLRTILLLGTMIATTLAQAAEPPRHLHRIMTNTAPVVALSAGKPVGTATAFFYRHGEDRFLVTNKHVVLPGGPQNPDALRVRLHVSKDDLTKNDLLEIPLYDSAKSPRWKEHNGIPEVDLVTSYSQKLWTD